MRKYEIMYIINSKLEEENRNKVIEDLHGIITSNGGKITDVNQMGLKEFAYRIEDMTKGYYVVTYFEADNDALKEFDRLIGINSNVVRYMIINKEEQ